MTRWLAALCMAIVVFPATVAPALAEEATPTAMPPLVAAYAAALNGHDPDGVAALYAEDAVVTQAVQDGLVVRGREAIRGWTAANLEGVPDLTVTTETVIAETDRIAWAWTYAGTYTGHFPGYPPGTGQPIVLRVVSLLELANGRITQETRYYDNAAFLRQIGALGVIAAATTGSVTVRVFVCPASLADTADAAELAAACLPSDAAELQPALRSLGDDEPLPGLAAGAGVYSWVDLPLGDYAVSGSVVVTGFAGLRVMNAAGIPVQNPGLRLTAASPHAQLGYYYFLTGLPEA